MKAFYSLQGAELSFQGLDPPVATRLYSVGVSTILTYGCEALPIAPPIFRQLQVQQGKLIKSFLGLRRCPRTTLLERALHMPSVSGYSGFLHPQSPQIMSVFCVESHLFLVLLVATSQHECSSKFQSCQ